MGDCSTSRGWVAQLANLGGTCDQALKLDNSPQASRPTTTSLC